MLKKIDSKVLGSVMLISGTSIGAAMLAMPITTGLFGFFGSAVVLLICWLFMYWMGLVTLEASLYFEEEVSFYSMAKKTLGPIGAFVTWSTFLMLFYALIAAYLSGSGKIIIDSLEFITGLNIPPFFDILPLLILFAPFIYFGLSIVDFINRILMYLMFFIFFILIFWLLPNIKLSFLSHIDFSYSLASFSLIITGFGYHVIIPSIVNYLDRDIKKIKFSLFYGSLLPFIVYFLWELVMLGNLPVYSDFGFLNALKNDFPLTKLLSANLGNDILSFLARAFSMFAVITSFLGVAQGLFDFLKDAMKIKFTHKRNLAFIFTFLPPIFFIIFFQNGFIVLLEYAGILVSIVLGFIPILIVWKLRSQDRKTNYKAMGGYISLFVGLLFFLFIIILVLEKNIFS